MEFVSVLLTPSHQRRYFVEEILEANLLGDHCLTAVVLDSTDLLVEKGFVSLRSAFLRELFALFRR